MKIVEQYFTEVKQKEFTREAIINFIAEDTKAQVQNIKDLINNKEFPKWFSIGTVHLRVPLEDFDSFISKLTLAKCYNDVNMDYKIYGESVFITTDFRQYLKMVSVFSSFKQYFDSSNDECYPIRYSFNLATNPNVLNKIYEKSNLCLGTKTYVVDTFAAPYWWSIAYGEYSEDDTFLGYEKEFINYCIYSKSLYDNLENTDACLSVPYSPYLQTKCIVSGFYNQWKELFKNIEKYKGDDYFLLKKIYKYLVNNS